jgi:carboxypeptidase D
MDQMVEKAQSCGYTDFFNKYSDAFPPPGPIPAAPDYTLTPGCDSKQCIFLIL